MNKKPQYPAPPAGLSERSKRIWSEVGPSNAPSAPRRVLLEEALRTLDRLAEVSAACSTVGLTSVTARTGMIHVSPVLRTETELRKAFLSAWNALGLPWHDKTDQENFR